MSRIITIIAVLLAGTVGLLMSVCGGFFFFAGAWQNLKSATHGEAAPGLNSWSLLLFAAVMLLLGGAVFIVCCRVLWRRLSGKE